MMLLNLSTINIDGQEYYIAARFTNELGTFLMLTLADRTDTQCYFFKVINEQKGQQYQKMEKDMQEYLRNRYTPPMPY